MRTTTLTNDTTNEGPRVSCYGAMFPDLRQRSADGGSAGKVFSLVTVTPAGMLRPRLRMHVNREAWEDCVHCPAFDHCYKLGLASLALQRAAEDL